MSVIMCSWSSAVSITNRLILLLPVVLCSYSVAAVASMYGQTTLM
jgi:hypothetical protein